MKQDLHSKRLLESLDDFVQQMRLLDKADNPKLISQLVIKWTRGQPLLTKKLLEYILEFKQKIVLGKEGITVETIIRNRLIKEFKQDSLTLAIRKILYARDFVKLLAKSGRNFTNQDQIYLQNQQTELGLANQQCQAIKDLCLQSIVPASIKDISNENSQLAITKAVNNLASENSYQELVLLIENSPIYHQISASNSNTEITQYQKYSWLLGLKHWWLLLLIPVSFLIFRYTQEQDAKTITTKDVIHPKNSCQDLTNVESSRLSLGEKLLIQEYNYLNPSGKNALFEATEAFSRCEYSLAQNKFEQALDIEKNNPEALIYFNNAQAIVQENFKIAVSVPLGSKPEIAQEMLRGVAQAQTEINQQGGIRSKPLLVQIANDDNDPELVTLLAQQLAADQKILAVVGHNDSNTSIAASDIYQKQGLTMISPTSTSTKLSGIGSYIMRTTPSVSVLANSLSSYASLSSFNNIAICFDSDSSSSTSFAQEFVTDINQNGAEIVNLDCDFAQENFNPVPAIKQAIAQNADALLLATSVNNIHQAVSLAIANQNRLPLLGNHSLYTFETIETGAAVAGMVLSTPWLPETSSQTNFAENANKFWGGQVNWRTAMSYDAAQAIIQSLEYGDTRSDLQGVLTNPNFSVNGASEVFRFQEGDRLGQVQLVYVGKLEQDSDNYQFLPLDINQKTNSF